VEIESFQTIPPELFLQFSGFLFAKAGDPGGIFPVNDCKRNPLSNIPGMEAEIRSTVKKSVDLQDVWIYVTDCWRRVVLVSRPLSCVSCLWLPVSPIDATGPHYSPCSGGGRLLARLRTGQQHVPHWKEEDRTANTGPVERKS
jgi:hypothetical protein